MSTTESTARKGKSSKIPGATLTPDLKKHAASIGKRYAYWIGALPTVPNDVVYLGGIGFPKMTERVTGSGQETKRFPMIGSVVHMDDDQVRRIQDQIPRVVVRFNGPDTGEMEGLMPDRPKRKGHLVTIPTDAEIEAARRNNRSRRAYVNEEFDEPVARHIFMALCPDQKRPSTGSTYPEPLSETGIEWPDSL